MSDDSKNGKAITFPSGGIVSTRDVGAHFIIEKASTVLTEPEPLDPVDAKQELRDRIAYVRNQPIVKITGDNCSASQIIDAVLHEIAEEASHLKWERRKASKIGRNTVPFTTARINALKNLADTVAKRKELSSSENFDTSSPRFQKIFKVWMQFFYEAMEKSNVPSEVINVVFQQMKADMVDWEKRLNR